MLVIRTSNKVQLRKSINDVKLNYFKSKILKILDEKEREEDNLTKSVLDFYDKIEKGGRAATIGEIRTWNGKKYKKMPDKKWVRIYDKQNRSSEISIARLKGKVRRAESVEELFNIVMNNVHRFTDENGKTLDIVSELKAEVDKRKKTVAATSKPVQAQKEIFDVNTLPEQFTKSESKSTFDNLYKFLNTQKIENPIVVDLLKNLGGIVTHNGKLSVGINIVKKHYCYNALRNQVYIPEIKDSSDTDKIESVIHELGHCIDRNLLITYRNKDLSEKPFRGKKLKKFSEKEFKYFQPYNGMDENGVSEIKRQLMEGIYQNGTSQKVVEKQEKIDRLCDIYDALSGGSFLQNYTFLIGHGSDYKDVRTRASETFANYLVLSAMLPDQLKMLKENQPELCETMDKLMEYANNELKTLNKTGDLTPTTIKLH